MEYSTFENAVNDTLLELHKMVTVVKQDAEVSLEYMKIFEKERMLIEEGIEEGMERGRQEARLQFEEERQKLLEQQQLAVEKERNKRLEQQRQAEEEIQQLRKALAKLSASKNSVSS